jgi:hypothetical protein
MVAGGRWEYRKEPVDTPPRQVEKQDYHTYGFAKKKEAAPPRKE